MKSIIDLKQDTLEIKNINKELNQVIKQHKEDLLDSVQDAPQRVIIRRYLSILHELCRQACACLDAKAYSTLEALSRVIMEQTANMLYISMDDGSNARALLRSSKQLTESNGKAWANYLASQSAANPAAQARQVSGAAMLERIDKRWPDIKRYPSGKGLFSALGWESHYYAFYSPLCDSVHSFSDEMSALVDFSDLYSISEAEAEKSLTYWNKERLRLAIYHFVVATGLRTEAFSRCCSSLAPDLHEISSEGLLIKINTLIMRHDLFDHSRLKEMESGMAKPDEFVINI